MTPNTLGRPRANIYMDHRVAVASEMTPFDVDPDTTAGRTVEARPDERDFTALRDTYRASGGIASGDDLARLMEDQQRGEFLSLARLIASHAVFGFEWRRCFWVPMFQFELRDLSLKRAPGRVLAELATAFDGWELAGWFVEPNCWLNERRPLDLLETKLDEVLGAARADRFIAAR